MNLSFNSISADGIIVVMKDIAETLGPEI